jgi:hypothetical protein
MSLLDQIRTAQRDAGEAAVIAHLDSLGLSNVTDKKDNANAPPVQEPDADALDGDIDLFDDARSILEIIVHDQPADLFRDARALIPKLRARIGMPPIINFTTPPAAPTAPVRPVAWADAEAISNLPAVDEAIRALLDDKTADNATAVVQAILGAIPPAAQPAPVRVPDKHLQLALEALALLEKLFTQADEQGILAGANVDCQIATNDLRKSAYAASDIRTHLNTPPAPVQPVQEPVAIHQFRAPGLADCIEAYTAIKQAQTQTVQEPVAYTTGHCIEKAKPGGCPLHNLHCNFPACDRKES